MKNTMKKLLALSLATLMLVGSLAGCGGSDAAASTGAASAPAASVDPASGEVWKIGLDYSTNACEYCVNYAEEIKRLAEAEGFEMILTQCDKSVNTQLSNIEAMTIKGCQIVSAIWEDSNACLPAVQTAMDNDAFLISSLNYLENDADGYEKHIIVGSENYDGGYLQGEWLAKNLPDDADIWYMFSTDGDPQCDARKQGMIDALAEAGRDDVEIVAIEYTQNQRDKGVTVMETWLQAYDDIDCVVGCSDQQILGAIEAAKGANRMDDTIFVGFDACDAAQESMAAGEMACSILQDYKAQAQSFVDVCVKLRDGADPATENMDVNAPYAVIDQSNVSEYLA